MGYILLRSPTLYYTIDIFSECVHLLNIDKNQELSLLKLDNRTISKDMIFKILNIKNKHLIDQLNSEKYEYEIMNELKRDEFSLLD